MNMLLLRQVQVFAYCMKMRDYDIVGADFQYSVIREHAIALLIKHDSKHKEDGKTAASITIL